MKASLARGVFVLAFPGAQECKAFRQGELPQGVCPFLALAAASYHPLVRWSWKRCRKAWWSSAAATSAWSWGLVSLLAAAGCCCCEATGASSFQYRTLWMCLQPACGHGCASPGFVLLSSTQCGHAWVPRSQWLSSWTTLCPPWSVLPCCVTYLSCNVMPPVYATLFFSMVCDRCALFSSFFEALWLLAHELLRHICLLLAGWRSPPHLSALATEAGHQVQAWHEGERLSTASEPALLGHPAQFLAMLRTGRLMSYHRPCTSIQCSNCAGDKRRGR